MPDAVEVKGADRLASTLREFARSLDDLSDANRRAGEAIGSAARGRVPKRTGRLAGSMRIDAAPKDVSVAFGAVHAAPIHWGVGPRVGLRGPHNIAPTLFLTGALAASEDEVADIYVEAIDRRMGKVRGA
jgi:hypothetical protein